MRLNGTLVSLAVFHNIKVESFAEHDNRRLPLECHDIDVTGAWPGL
jgi:hypothetical protein